MTSIRTDLPTKLLEAGRAPTATTATPPKTAGMAPGSPVGALADFASVPPQGDGPAAVVVAAFRVDEPPPDIGPVDLAQFMVDDDEAELLGGEQPWDEVPVSKPRKDGAILVHPDVSLRAQLLAFEDKDSMEPSYYLVAAAAGQYIPELVMPIVFVPYITPKGTVKLWPIKAKRDARGEMNKWSKSALTLCNKYAGQWLRVIPDDGFYRTQLMRMNHEPKWPTELSQQALIDRAFAGKLIVDKSHPVVRHMLGA